MAHCPLMKGESMTHLELGDGWSIGHYDGTDHDVYHSGCKGGALNRPCVANRIRCGVGTPSGELWCYRCSMKAPDEVVGMLHLCRWER